jgi:hypothetical protein
MSSKVIKGVATMTDERVTFIGIIAFVIAILIAAAMASQSLVGWMQRIVP